MSVLRKSLNDKDDGKCDVCKGDESRFMRQCENCLFWNHYKCAKMDAVLMNRLESYYCSACREVNKGMKLLWKNTSKKVTLQEKEKYYFPVSAIVRHKENNNKRFFLIQWESYKKSDRTWEPEGNLDGCLNKLQEYLEKNNLPYSRVEGLMGAVVDEENNFDERNWVTMGKVLEVFGEMSREYFAGCNVLFQEYVGELTRTGCYFLRYNHHCYAIFYDSEKKLATIGDGCNYFRKNIEVSTYITNLLGVRIRSIYWRHMVAVDHCASAAILIQLELFRDHVADRYRQIVESPRRWRERLVKQLHNHPSLLLNYHITRQRWRCACGKIFRVRKRFLCHRQLCGHAMAKAFDDANYINGKLQPSTSGMIRDMK